MGRGAASAPRRSQHLLRAAVLAVAALGALAPASHADAPIYVKPPPPIPDDQWAAQYAKDTGLTFDEALRRVQIQHRANPLPAELKTSLGTGYAGVWVDPADGSIRVGATTDEDRATIAKALDGAGLAGDAEIVDVESTRADLEAAQHTLDVELAEATKAGRVATEIDDAHNRVIVDVAPSVTEDDLARVADLRKAFAAGRLTYDAPQPPVDPSPLDPASREPIYPTAPVERQASISVREVPEWKAAATACSSESCGLPLRAGVKIFSDYGSTRHLCSAGFIGTWWSGSATYFFDESAGHCMYDSPNPTWSAYDVDAGSSYAIGNRNSYRFGTTTGNPTYLPTFDAGSFGMDYALHWTNILAPVLWMHGWAGGEYWGVTGQAVAVQGEYGCRTGYASTYTCGTVQSTSNTVSYSGITVTNLVRVPGACPVPGDSGGAYIDGGTALGITSGRSDYAGGCDGLFAHTWDISYWLGINVWH